MNKSNGKPSADDVAREAGVSQATVSFVMSGSKHADRISPQTKRRVIAAARRLGYTRNSAGAALRRGYSDTVVLLAVTWELAAAHAHTTMAVNRAAATRGLTTIIHVASDDREATAFLDNVQSLNPYGIALLWDSSAKPVDQLSGLIEEGLPVIDLMPSGTGSIVSVTADRKHGARLATRHLIEQGHRRIGMILDTASRSSTSFAKLAGYREVLQESGVEFHESLLQEVTGFGFEAGLYAMRILVNRRPDMTAVMCINDPVALGALMAAQDMGLVVPDDVSIVGYGAHPEGTYVRPSLTTLAIPSNRIAEDAVDILVRMRQEENYLPEAEYVPMELVVRDSTGPAKAPRVQVSTGIASTRRS